jgi:hypothetical protein
MGSKRNTCLRIPRETFTGDCILQRIYRLKEDQAFSLSLELGQREKVVRHPSANFLALPPKESSPQPVYPFV